MPPQRRRVRWLDESRGRLHLNTKLSSDHHPFVLILSTPLMRLSGTLLIFAYAQQGERKRGRDEAGAERRIPWGKASETKDVKKIPTGVSEAGDDAWSREIPPPGSGSLELYSGSGRRKGGGRHSSVITKFMQKSRNVEAFK